MRQNLSNFFQDWPETRVHAEVNVSATQMKIAYMVEGIENLLIPPPSPTPQFREGLWRHTCFEFFVRPNSLMHYVEFNFSPSGDWAVFGFSGYRVAQEKFDSSGMVVGVHCEKTTSSLQMEATLDRRALNKHFIQDKPWEFRSSLTTVLESLDQKISYWALNHGKIKPDFHLPETFVLPVTF